MTNVDILDRISYLPFELRLKIHNTWELVNRKQQRFNKSIVNVDYLRKVLGKKKFDFKAKNEDGPECFFFRVIFPRRMTNIYSLDLDIRANPFSYYIFTESGPFFNISQIFNEFMNEIFSDYDVRNEYVIDIIEKGKSIDFGFIYDIYADEEIKAENPWIYREVGWLLAEDIIEKSFIRDFKSIMKIGTKKELIYACSTYLFKMHIEKKCDLRELLYIQDTFYRTREEVSYYDKYIIVNYEDCEPISCVNCFRSYEEEDY